jgi:hypothetical protein
MTMDTKALDEILKVAKCTQFPFEMIDQAAAELAELKDLAISWQARWDTCDKERMKLRAELAELRAENTEMRETLADLVVMIADFAHLLPQGAKIAFENAAAVLAKHPEEKK